jgi:hypothetical protein
MNFERLFRDADTIAWSNGEVSSCGHLIVVALGDWGEFPKISPLVGTMYPENPDDCPSAFGRRKARTGYWYKVTILRSS